MLGWLEVRRGRDAVELAGQRQRSVLVALLVNAGQVVSVDAIGEAIWGDDQPGAPRNAVQTAVARLRSRLGDDQPIVTRSPGYVLDVGPDELDALRFEALLDQAMRRRDDPAEVCRRLEEGLSLWRGPAYAGFADGIARAEALRLEEQRLVAVEELAAARLALGEASRVLPDLDAEEERHPFRERLVELRMRALAAVDRAPEALDALRSYRRRLVEETGLEPSASIRDLEGRILRGEAQIGVEPPPGRSRTGRGTFEGGGPPAATKHLVGREGEITEIRRALGRHRVVTLTGVGGVGKTHVASEVARAVIDERVREVGWVELASVEDAGAVDHVVAGALGIDLGGGSSPRDSLVRALASRDLLLVLDNAEHLLDAVAPLVGQIQRHCAAVSILVTSRERLAVDGERLIGLAPLETEAGDATGTADAVRLFVDRAAEAGVAIDPDSEPAAAAICRELDGLPLAIELAAARTSALRPADLLTALREGATRAIGQRRGQPDRHRDLQAVVDWSYQLLEEDQRVLFERLGVFAGAFRADDAHAICALEGWTAGETVAGIGVLTERSLVTMASDDPDRIGRFRLLRPLRAFARQRLAERGELAAVQERHTAVITARAERAAGPPLDESGWRWLESTLDDLREVRRRAMADADISTASRLVAAIFRFDYLRRGVELLAWADDILELDGAERDPRAPEVHAAAAVAAWRRGDLPAARRLAERGIKHGRSVDDPGVRLAYEALGDVCTFEGRLSDAREAFEEEIRLARLAGDPDAEALGLASVALVSSYGGDVEVALQRAGEASRAAVPAGEPTRTFVRYAQGECLADRDPMRAIEILDEAAGRARACHAWFADGVARLTSASLRARHGEPAAALPAFRDLILHWRRSGSWVQQWTTLRNLAELCVRLGADEPAVTIASAARARSETASVFGSESERLHEAMASARERLGSGRFEVARSRGRSMTPHEVVELALATAEELASSPTN